MKHLWLMTLATVPLAALAAGSETQPTVLNPVTVTATRTPVLQSKALASTIIITRSEIERAHAIDVAQLLQQYAGLEVSRSGGPGQPASLFIRGANSNYTVVLIDGVRIDDATTGAAPLADISPEMIERIEVIEGTRAALYGPDAIGGVVNIITRQPGPSRLDTSISGGSFDTVSGAAALRDQGNLDGHRWGVVFDTQQQHSAGFPTFAGSGNPSAYRNRTLNGRGTLDIGHTRLEVRAWDTSGNTSYLNTNFDYPPPSYQPAFTGFTPAASDFHDQILAIETRYDITPIWQTSLTFSRSLYRLAQDQPDPGSGQPGFARVIRPELDWHNVIAADPHNRVSFGVRADREHVDAVSYGSAYEQNKDTEYGYMQDEASFGRNHAVAAASYLHDGVFGGRFDWNLEYGYDLFEQTRLITSAGSAFRAPTASELYYPGISNPNLRPEKAQSYALAVQQGIALHQHAQLRIFRTDVRDYIAYGKNFIPQNIDAVRLEGIQATWRYVSAGWDARVDAIWQDPRNLSTDRSLQRRARLIGSARIDRHVGRYDIGAGIYSTTRRPDIGAIYGGSTTDGGYTLLSVHAGVQLAPHLHLGARLDNVFNHHYETAAGYNQPGSAVYATLRYTLPL